MNRVTVSLITVATLSLLVACGGGGSSPTDPGNPPGGVSVTVTAPDAVIPSTHSDVSQTVSWSVTGTTGAVNVTMGDAGKTGAVKGRDYVVIGTGTSGSATVSLTGGANDIYVYDSTGAQIGKKTATGACDANSTWDTAKVCAPKSGWKYDSFVLTIYMDNCKKLGWVDFTSTDTDKVKELVNKTGHNENVSCTLALGAVPVANDGTIVKLPSGLLIASLVTPGDSNTRRWFPINPVTKEILPEWTGAVPDNTLRNTQYGNLNETPYANYGVSQKGMYADITGHGTVYFLDQMKVLYLTPDNFQNSSVLSDRTTVQGGFQFVVLVPGQ